MERRFRQIHISAEIVASYGKTFMAALTEMLPRDTVLMFKDEDLSTGCLHILIYNASFDLLDRMDLVPVWNEFEMPVKPISPIVTLN